MGVNEGKEEKGMEKGSYMAIRALAEGHQKGKEFFMLHSFNYVYRY